MKTIGFTGYVALGRLKGRVVGEIHPHEVMRLPDEAAADLLRATSKACDLTLDSAKAPYSAIVPTSMLGSRLWKLVR